MRHDLEKLLVTQHLTLILVTCDKGHKLIFGLMEQDLMVMDFMVV